MAGTIPLVQARAWRGRRLKPVHLAFLGCGFITRVHSRHLRKMPSEFVCSYASRDPARAAEYQRRHGGLQHYTGYDEALRDPTVDAVVVAVPPHLHLELALRALELGKHVVVEKPAFLQLDDYRIAIEAREQAGRVVLVAENDHYKPLAVALRRLLDCRDAIDGVRRSSRNTGGVIGELVFGQFVSVMRKPKLASDWRNDEAIAGGDAFFEEGIHWLHLAGSIGPRIRSIQGYQPPPSDEPLEGDGRRKSMLVAFQYDNGAAGSLYYSREIPALFRGLSLSKLFGRKGVVTFESNGAFIVVRGAGFPRLILPGFRDIRGYRAMYQDFFRAIRKGRTPEMSLERAQDDHRLMDAVYKSVEPVDS